MPKVECKTIWWFGDIKLQFYFILLNGSVTIRLLFYKGINILKVVLVSL